MHEGIQAVIDDLNAAEPRPTPEGFADNQSMIENGYELAKAHLVDREAEELFPTWAMLTENGQVAIVATPFEGARSKDLIAQAMKKFMREANVIRYTLTTEAWVSKVAAEEWEKDKRPPSERDDRIEIVMIIGGDRSGVSMHTYMIVRDGAGKVIELKPWEIKANVERFEGRFANMLEEGQ